MINYRVVKTETLDGLSRSSTGNAQSPPAQVQCAQTREVTFLPHTRKPVAGLFFIPNPLIAYLFFSTVPCYSRVTAPFKCVLCGWFSQSCVDNRRVTEAQVTESSELTGRWRNRDAGRCNEAMSAPWQTCGKCWFFLIWRLCSAQVRFSLSQHYGLTAGIYWGWKKPISLGYTVGIFLY